jgi:hypothetical protein
VRPEEQRDSHDAHVRKKWVAATKNKGRDNNTGPTQVAPTRAPAVMLVEVAPVTEDDLSKAQVQALVSNNEKDHAAPAVSIESPTKRSRMDDALMVVDESIMNFAAEEKHWQEQRCAFSLQTAIEPRSRKKQRETA